MMMMMIRTIMWLECEINMMLIMMIEVERGLMACLSVCLSV